jgi:hypothetical protein
MEQEETQFLARIRETLPGLAPQGPAKDQGHLRAETPPDPDHSLSLSSELGEDHRRSDSRSHTRPRGVLMQRSDRFRGIPDDDKGPNDLIQELPDRHTLKYRLDIEKAVRSKAPDVYKGETLEECRTFIIQMEAIF